MKVTYGTIIVADMEESVRFYTEVIGLGIDSRYNPGPGISITLLKGEGDAMVELIKNPAYEIGLYSVGMEVEDVKAAIEKFRSQGARITMEPVPITDGFLAFTEDPNGVRIALVQHG
ncbi:MAG: VOC family protein [Dehalococcoidales bacterium]|nr:VOC family protein [Dehalococcoidales bacterium]